MQKILRRVATAERVVEKRQKLRDTKLFKNKKKEGVSQLRQQQDSIKRELETAKQAVRDDWNLGPLSPRLDVGDREGHYGAINEARYKVQGTLPLAARNRRCQWAGGAYNLNIAIGDRVVLLEGPDKGRIGTIKSINPAQAEVVIKGLNMSNVRLPREVREEDSPPGFNLELPLPINAIRLVHPIQDPATGVVKDVIINQLAHASLIHDRLTGRKQWTRVVPGLNISIPWPKHEPTEQKDYKSDTLRIQVEKKTFVPTLLRPPIPEVVLDELRNKYSRFRTRHDPDYIARLEAEEQAKKDRLSLMETMRTPLQELHRVERANKKRKGKPRLTLEMLEEIGRVIAKTRERSLNAAGVTDVSASTTAGAAPAASETDIPVSTDSNPTTTPTSA